MSTDKVHKTDYLRLLSNTGEVFDAPKHLCAYLSALSPFVDDEPSALRSDNESQVAIPIEHATHASLGLIFDFLSYHDARTPETTIRLTDYDSATEALMEIDEHKVFNRLWFAKVLQSYSLRHTVRAATFLSNPYLLRLLVSGTEQVLLHGSAEHIRLFLDMRDEDAPEEHKDSDAVAKDANLLSEEEIEEEEEKEDEEEENTSVERPKQKKNRENRCDKTRNRMLQQGKQKNRSGVKRKRAASKENICRGRTRRKTCTLSEL